MMVEDNREAKREVRLLYLDGRIPVGRMEEIIEKVWEDIHDLEFDLFFGRFRGIHLGEDGVTIHVTWENAYGVRFVSSIIPDMDHTRIDYCPDELYDKEEKAVENRQQQREEADDA
jgi:hypothetical protein